MIERTLVILKPSAVQRGLCGEIISRFEKKGLKIAALKMKNLTDDILDRHYAHLKGKPFFDMLKRSMMKSPVVLICLEGVDAIRIVHAMAGATNGRNAALGTIRGDFCMSNTANIIHTSDSPEAAEVELQRFFNEEDYCQFDPILYEYYYAEDEI